MVDISAWDVVVVDDEPDNIGVVELVFQFHGATVRTATSGSQCLALLAARTPTLVLVDIQMPEMSGYELLEVIRQHPEWNSLPVIAITAHAKREDREQIMTAGFDGYIGKPISVMTLIDEIIQIVQARGL
ncbi:MAG: response regulator [Chloroflexi bacterium]|nr:response regulator [Chloroflexota bacterium]